jgi:hypothetical protein
MVEEGHRCRDLEKARLEEERLSQTSVKAGSMQWCVIKENHIWPVVDVIQRRNRNINRERNVHYRTGDEHVARGIHTLHTNSGRVFFFKLRIVAAKETAEEVLDIFDVRISRPRKTVWVQMVTVGLIVLLIPWVVDKEGI